MKFCKPHWEQLRNAINDRGLTDLVPKTGEEAIERVKKQQANGGKITPETYDPLITAHNMIVANALKAGGIYMLEGDFCPLCELDKNAEEMKETADDWIRKSADGVAAYAVEIGARQAQ